MARAIRELSPESKIILGGHGVNIPNIGSMIDHDFICKGEGVYFLRKLFKLTRNWNRLSGDWKRNSSRNITGKI